MDSVVSSIIQKFETRAQMGKEKYGTDLDRTDLTTLQWINHAQDELMDGILYLQKLKCETTPEERGEVNFEAIARSIMESLGTGFSEAVYHNAFEVELRKIGMKYETERVLPISYDGHTVGHVRLDLVVEATTVIELKAVAKLNEGHKNQLKMYMRHGGFSTGYLINFSDKGTVEVVCAEGGI
jgi:GxxExxY protein